MRLTLCCTLILLNSGLLSCSSNPHVVGPELGANPSLLPFDYAAEVAHGQFFLGPQDKVSIDFWKHEDLSRSYSIRSDGKVLFPYIGRIDAGGLTREEFEDKLILAYDEYIVDPVLAVSIEFSPSRKVTVLGEVNNRSVISLASPNTTILDIISQAGGLTENGDKAGVLIARKVNGIVNVRHYSLDGLFAPNDINVRTEIPLIQSGDVIYVIKTSEAEYSQNIDLIQNTLRSLNFAQSIILKSPQTAEIIVGE